MGQAISLVNRQRTIELREQGESQQSICEVLGISLTSVKTICRRYRQRGLEGLTPDYCRCGRKQNLYAPEVVAEVLGQREQHPRWGAPRLHVSLSPPGKSSKPAIRTMQRWFRKAGLYKPRRQANEPSIGRSVAPHNIWEVDAKEQLTLLDGSPACYLTIVDEKSGAWLEAPVFPP